RLIQSATCEDATIVIPRISRDQWWPTAASDGTWLHVNDSQATCRGLVNRLVKIISERRAEGVGFEPTSKVTPTSGFQDRRHRPLGEPSCVDQPYAKRNVGVVRETGLRGTAKPSPTRAASDR